MDPDGLNRDEVYYSRSLLGVLAVRFFDASSIILRYYRCRPQRYIEPPQHSKRAYAGEAQTQNRDD